MFHSVFTGREYPQDRIVLCPILYTVCGFSITISYPGKTYFAKKEKKKSVYAETQ